MVELCWRHEVATDGLGYPRNEKDRGACVGVEYAAQIMIGRRHDGGYQVRSVVD